MEHEEIKRIGDDTWEELDSKLKQHARDVVKELEQRQLNTLWKALAQSRKKDKDETANESD